MSAAPSLLTRCYPQSVADLNFSQPERRNVAVPLLLALLVLGLAGFFLFRLTPRSTADVFITRVDVFPAHTVFKSESNVVGEDPSQDDLYALVTVRLTDRLHLPLFLKDITATLIPSDGTLPPATSAVEHSQLDNLYTSFPALRKLAAAQAAPLLLRESRIDPNQTVEGYVIVHFPVTAETWNTRNNAVLTLDLYHQQSLSVTIPKPPAPSAAPAEK